MLVPSVKAAWIERVKAGARVINSACRYQSITKLVRDNDADAFILDIMGNNEVRKDYDVMLALVKETEVECIRTIIGIVDANLWDNPDFIIDTKVFSLLDYVSERLKHDKEFALRCIKVDPWNIFNFRRSPDIMYDPVLVAEAYSRDNDIIRSHHYSPELAEGKAVREHPDFVERVFRTKILK